MSVELTMLFYSLLLFFVTILIPATEGILKVGLAPMAGPRDDLQEPSTYNKRATRLRNNMAENLLLFGGLVLVANAAEVSTANTVLGAQIFFYARAAHAVFYLGGWPWVRTMAWMVSVVGMGMIALPLL
ncbi:MAG: MAPEG family protein [Sphingomonadales bacterium]